MATAIATGTLTNTALVPFSDGGDIWDAVDEVDGPQLPDPITFVIGPQWLDRPNLYPRQATLLKIIFLRDDLFTDYDHQVIAEWIAEFHATNPDAGPENKFRSDTNGIQPDIYERIAWLKARGYRWFKEVIFAIGRRGGKGYVCALAMAYVLWAYMERGNPQDHYGIDRDKQLAILIFAGKKEQAVQNLWGDLDNVITGAPCFGPYVSTPQTATLTVFAPYDKVRRAERAGRGINSTKDIASFAVMARESTLLAGRGPAGCILGFDEAAHVKNAGTSRAFGDVYGSATPALDQFGRDAFICIPSSTWEMTGMFYELWEQSLEQEPDDMGELRGVYPNKLMLQLASWDPYIDWAKAHELDLFPAGFAGDLGEYLNTELPRLKQLKGALQVYDEEMAKKERANPDTFAVERRSHWATSMEAYLNAGKVDAMFAPWEERPPEFGRPELQMQISGPMTIAYRAHGDPANVNCRFGFAMAHTEKGPDGYLHAVFDLIKFWDPASYADHFIDYDEVTDWIFDNVVLKFRPSELTFDQFNVPSTVKRLQKKIRGERLPKRVQVYERPATQQLNWATYECFKGALNMGFVHAPLHEEARDELKFVQKPEKIAKVVPPESGPVTTKDIADCIAIVTAELLGEQMVAFLADELSAQRPGAGMHTSSTDPMSRFDPSAISANPLAAALSGAALSRGARPGSTRIRFPGSRPQSANMPGMAAMRRHRS
jgi:hypothetical protein